MSGKDIERMRMVVSDAYPGMKWKARVAKMPTNQVVAVYKSIMNRSSRLQSGNVYGIVVEREEFHQYNLFEFGLEVAK